MPESFEIPKQTPESNKQEMQIEVRPGKWHLTIQFLDQSDKTYKIEKDINIYSKGTLADLEREAISYASGTGLHNFGMNTYVGKYPDGHPVEFNLVHGDDADQTHRFVKNFNGSGYPVKLKVK